MRQAAHVFYLQNSVHKSAYLGIFFHADFIKKFVAGTGTFFKSHKKWIYSYAVMYIGRMLCFAAWKMVVFSFVELLPHRPANPLTGSQTMLSCRNRYHPGPDTPFLLQMYNQYQKVLLFFYYRIFSDDESVTYHFSNPASFFTVWHMYFIILHIYGICKLVFINLWIARAKISVKIFFRIVCLFW